MEKEKIHPNPDSDPDPDCHYHCHCHPLRLETLGETTTGPYGGGGGSDWTDSGEVITTITDLAYIILRCFVEMKSHA